MQLAEAPFAEWESPLTVTQLAPGNGPVVRAGDLVKVRIKRKDGGSIQIYYDERAKEVEAWLWTASEGRSNPKDSFAQDAPWGGPGSRTVRVALIGRAVHERLEISAGGQVGRGFGIPQRGCCFTWPIREIYSPTKKRERC